MVPPLSASFIIMLSSIVNDFIEFCSEIGKLYFILSFLVGSFLKKKKREKDQRISLNSSNKGVIKNR